MKSKDDTIRLELTPQLEESEIVTNFVFRRSINSIILSLNHVYDKKIIISNIYSNNWPKTTDTFARQMKLKGIKDKHTLQLCDVLDNNFERILGLKDCDNGNGEGQDNDRYSEERHKTCDVRKYTGNGTLALYEAVVINDESKFLQLSNETKPILCSKLERQNRTLYPADTIDTQNPIPYIFESIEELQHYLERARKETYDTLHFKVKSTFKKYVNAEEHYIVILAADTIYSYFQDKFATVHYNIFVGDNGSGKNSALLVYRQLGYRVFYVVAASAPNYFTFLGEIEECQGTIAEDEADDIVYDKEKKRIMKTGYASGGNVPKVDISNGRSQGSYLTYCMKWFAMEELPDYKMVKGILDRSFVYNFIVGNVAYNIKDVIKYAGDPIYEPLHNELEDIRKLLFAFRMLHYNDIIPDVKLNVKHRTEELTKPLLRLYSSLNNGPIAVEEIRVALSKFTAERNELKRNSIESKLRDAINNLIKRHKENTNSDEYENLPQYGFYNEQIYAEVRTVMDGKDVPFKSESFYSIESGSLSHKRITRIFKSKFKAQPFKIGSGSDTKRGLMFSKEVLDRIAIYYNLPDEIKILHNDNEGENCANDTPNRGAPKQPQDTKNDEGKSATDATDATLSGTRHGSSEDISENDHYNNNEENMSNSYNFSKLHDSSSDTPSVDSQDNAVDNPGPCSTSVASVASVAGSKDKEVENKTFVTPRCVIEKVRLPEIPCMFCNYKNCIEFDLCLHYLELHKPELFKLPIGNGSMEYRAEYAISVAKERLAESFTNDEKRVNNDYY